jgi:hypothetical protein
MTLLATERIKLFTTRSPWWSMLLALVLSVGFAALIAANVPSDTTLSVSEAEGGYQFSLVVMMVMAALAVTTEYRFGTIRVSFQAVPNRIALLLAKTGVVAVLAAIIGEVTAFASWAVARLIHPSAFLALNSESAWRGVAGMGLVYAITADLHPAGGEPGGADPEGRPDDPEVDAVHRGQQLPGGRCAERGAARSYRHAAGRVAVAGLLRRDRRGDHDNRAVHGQPEGCLTRL